MPALEVLVVLVCATDVPVVESPTSASFAEMYEWSSEPDASSEPFRVARDADIEGRADAVRAWVLELAEDAAG